MVVLLAWRAFLDNAVLEDGGGMGALRIRFRNAGIRYLSVELLVVHTSKRA